MLDHGEGGDIQCILSILHVPTGLSLTTATMGIPVRNACAIENSDSPIYLDSLNSLFRFLALKACHAATNTTNALTVPNKGMILDTSL